MPTLPTPPKPTQWSSSTHRSLGLLRGAKAEVKADVAAEAATVPARQQRRHATLISGRSRHAPSRWSGSMRAAATQMPPMPQSPSRRAPCQSLARRRRCRRRARAAPSLASPATEALRSAEAPRAAKAPQAAEARPAAEARRGCGRVPRPTGCCLRTWCSGAAAGMTTGRGSCSDGARAERRTAACASPTDGRLQSKWCPSTRSRRSTRHVHCGTRSWRCGSSVGTPTSCRLRQCMRTRRLCAL
mmetsp:Transcript_42880/g.128696  ORF Transcript_42880/g.128696 Transcript_42880/m.128696 type:complete len:244 (+) Transcript_42880:55-786(+)